MQIWNSGVLLLVLGMIVLSLENNFERPHMIIVFDEESVENSLPTRQ